MHLTLAENEVSSLEQPPVLYVSPARAGHSGCFWRDDAQSLPLSLYPRVQFLVPRQSYLHSLVPQALQQLQHLLPPGDATPWFEHGRLPLKWCVAPSHPPWGFRGLRAAVVRGTPASCDNTLQLIPLQCLSQGPACRRAV